MTIFNEFREKIKSSIIELQKIEILPSDIKIDNFSVEPPRDEKHGDIATNVAMVFCKAAKSKPRDLAEHFVKILEKDNYIEKIEIAGAGFINLTLSDDIWNNQIKEILKRKTSYGVSDLGKGKKVNLEYVSANPTGPLHVGHVRGAVFGDALSRLLSYVGYDVTKEYYINDAGSQIDILANSVFLRYRQALGQEVTIPEGYYPGEYLIPVGKKLVEEYNDKLIDMDKTQRHELLCEYSVSNMMDLIRDDLKILDIKHDVFTSEKKLVSDGAVEKSLNHLSDKGLVYEGTLEPPKGKKIEDWEPREQTLFKSSQFGDDVDRPLLKSDKSFTYFASDIAYHYDKFNRGADLMVNIWGADHGGYVGRIHAAICAISDSRAELQVKLCQIVHLFKDGKPYKMSKRAGSFITLRDIVDAVGKDVVRFMMLYRKNEAQLDFDFAKVTQQTKDNPVFYVQYAYARIFSVLDKAKDYSDTDLENADLSELKDISERQIIRKMASFGRVIEQAAEASEPHRLAFYLYDLASDFHSFWNKGKENPSLRFIISDNPDITKARLAMIRALSWVIKSALDILGVSSPRQM